MSCLQDRWKIEGKNLIYYGLRNTLFKLSDYLKRHYDLKAKVEIFV